LKRLATQLLLPRLDGATMLRAKAEDDMKFAYDIFRKFAEGGPVWIETVHGMDTCKSRLHDLVRRNPGEYFAFDPSISRVVANSSDLQVL
jgi:hypothetical protein